MFTHRRPGCPAFSGISGGDIGTTPPSSLEPVRVQLIAPRYPALAPPSADPSSGLRGGASVARICFVGPRYTSSLTLLPARRDAGALVRQSHLGGTGILPA